MTPNTSLSGRWAFLAPFTYRGYSPLWAAGVLASLGLWIETVAQGWLVLELTDSPFLLGVSAAGRGLAMLLFGAVGGVAADMTDRRKVMIFVQLVSAATAFAISFLVVTHLINFWYILVLGFLNGAANAANQPSRQSYIYDLVSREHLSKAVALNSMANHATRIVGPFASGLLIVFMGIEGCYFLNGVCRLASVVALAMTPKDIKSIPQAGTFWMNLREGFEYVWGNKLVLSLVGTEVLADTFAFSYRFMLPVFARDVLGVGPIGLGTMYSAAGAGAMVGAVVAGYLGDTRSKGIILPISLFGFGASLVLFSMSPWYLLALVFLFAAGAAATSYDTMMVTIIQVSVPDEIRGRVLGIYGLTFGMTSFGSLQAGAIATLVSAPFAVGMGGAIVAIYALLLSRVNRRLRATR